MILNVRGVLAERTDHPPPMTPALIAWTPAWRARSVAAIAITLATLPAHARSRGCSVDCELQSAIGLLLIGLGFLYGILVFNTGSKISARQQLLYVAATVATGALAWTAARYALGLAPWPAAGVMAALVLAVFVYCFNPRRHRARHRR
ncbi:MAG: hypothetical protein RJA10_1271 [Pseudomonadota bacterium]|jgi:hypothetical protein